MKTTWDPSGALPFTQFQAVLAFNLEPKEGVAYLKSKLNKECAEVCVCIHAQQSSYILAPHFDETWVQAVISYSPNSDSA